VFIQKRYELTRAFTLPAGADQIEHPLPLDVPTHRFLYFRSVKKRRLARLSDRRWRQHLQDGADSRKLKIGRSSTASCQANQSKPIAQSNRSIITSCRGNAAVTNKCLAQSNKSLERMKATKKQNHQ
jgi:hypothetical protein